MKNNSVRRGSALLIVLGMMAFIVVSAVAFSAYMRYSRLPSSYLRRTSASRLLVKAALAEAIDAIDRSIGNNPYPGVGGNYYQENGSLSQKNRNNYLMNRWEDRVFIGAQYTVPAEDTISTLTVEGLAYIPAPFINEMRYWSRRSPAAEWHTMGFDAGRYAFSALDVSDCFDVNRLLADVPRDSSDENRITLSHCFERHVNPNDSGDSYFYEPAQWDRFMENYVDENHSKVPLVSVADLNLAIADQIGGETAKKLSPFYRYISQNSDAYFVESEDNDDAALMRNLAFVTDSYFPMTNRNANAIDLAREQDQPFAGFQMASNDDPKKNDDSVEAVFLTSSSKFLNRYQRALQGPEVVQLYDYLDRDSVPLSLALPTVERTPMITGLALEGDLSLTVQKVLDDPNVVGETNPRTGEVLSYFHVKTANLHLVGNRLRVSAGFAYPFKYSRDATHSFRAQAGATIVLVRESDEKKALRRAKAVAPAALTRDAWTTSQKSATAVKYGDEATPVVVTVLSSPKAISMPSKSITEEEDAVLQDIDNLELGSFDLEFTGDIPDPNIPNFALPNSAKKGTFRSIQKLNQSRQPVGNPNLMSSLRPSSLDLDRVLEGMENGERYVPVVQVWVRILDENNQVVDLVPACLADDDNPSTRLGDIVRGSKDRPLLRFYHQGGETDIAFDLSDDTIEKYGTKTMSIYPKAYVADDPRFNYAPENLVALDSLDQTFQNYWIDNVLPRARNRDGDIFMMTSDAGYLQSAYELTALLDICGLRGSTDMTPIDSTAYNGNMRTSFGDSPAHGAMWTTYSQFEKRGHQNEISPLDIISGSKGFRVNPYTSDVNVMLAALANTPMDWWAASTNDEDSVKRQMLSNMKEGNKYTFSSHNGAAIKIKHGAVKGNSSADDSLVDLARKMMTHFRHLDNDRGWEDAFDHEINWNEEDRIDGVDLGVTLHSVDKKFLHGYWRECFGNRQQLFLIFVRAEPMMLGGGGLGQTPPQLGARAVALVWRDPHGTGNDDDGVPKPHRTRILFYRQFD